jgi:hypothetical protein
VSPPPWASRELSLFYVQLAPKLAGALDRPAAVA